jgi:hypothetical protein
MRSSALLARMRRDFVDVLQSVLIYLLGSASQILACLYAAVESARMRPASPRRNTVEL